MVELKKGDVAPDFELENQFGEKVSSRGFRGRKLLLYFYPKASTPGCTTQSCAVRDALELLAEHGVAAVGISSDKPAAQAKFDTKYGLGFPLLCDVERAAANAYAVVREKSMFANTFLGVVRSSFLVDEDGLVLEAWYKVSPGDTVPNVRKALGIK